MRYQRTPSFLLSRNVFLLDLAACYVSFLIIWVFKLGLYSKATFPKYVLLSITFSVVFSIVCFTFESYKIDHLVKMRTAVYKVSKSLAVAFSISLFVAFILKETSSFSRTWAVSAAALMLLLMMFIRYWASRAFARMIKEGGDSESAVLIADVVPSEFAHLTKVLAERSGLAVASCFTIEELMAYGESLHSRGSKIVDLLHRESIQHAVIYTENYKDCELEHIRSALAPFSLNVYLVSGLSLFSIPRAKLKVLGDVCLYELQEVPISEWNYQVKRLIDMLGAAFLLVSLSPLMILVGVAIKLESSGPILFRQPRIGLNNQVFELIKFRSMYFDKCDIDATILAVKHDPRITKIGRIIRKTSIDELPQLWNVLVGDMSLIGPRPHALKASADGEVYSSISRDYFGRHRIVPGITGWAQVNGWRGETDTKHKLLKRLEYDMYYVDNWSFWLDFKIALMTIKVLLVNSSEAH